MVYQILICGRAVTPLPFTTVNSALWLVWGQMSFIAFLWVFCLPLLQITFCDNVLSSPVSSCSAINSHTSRKALSHLSL